MSIIKDFFKDILRYWYLLVFLIFLVVLRIVGYENCLFHFIFHYPCPGCGLTRAFLSCFRGDFRQAFRYHPLFVLIPVIVVLFLFKNVKRLKWLYYKNLIWYFIIFVFILTYIIRIFVYFPQPFLN